MAITVHSLRFIVAVGQTTTVKDRDKIEQHRGFGDELN
jgi:hypothetical protein